MTIRPQVEELLADRYSTLPEYPWAGDPSSAVFRHLDNKKWFGLIMTVRPRVLGLQSDEFIDILNVKCDQVLASSLCREPGFLPGYHMNKKLWLTVLLDGTVPVGRINMLLDMSYDLTGKKLRN